MTIDGVLDETPSNLSRFGPGNYSDNLDVESLVEQICDELEGTVDRAVVDQVVQELAFHSQHARVKTFVSIFVKRDAIDLLR